MFLEDDIVKIIQNLDPKKAHGHDQISIFILNICVYTIYKPLERIYSECLNTDLFMLEQKKDNLVPIYNKGDEQLLKYHPSASI